MKIDETNLKILKILEKDGRKSFTEIAKELGISDAAIHIRVKKMIKKGIIKKFTININDEILGHNINGFLLLNVVPGNLNSVTQKLMENINVIEVYEIFSTNDLMVKLKTQSLDDLRESVKSIRQIPNISSTNLLTGLKKWEK
jgi:Lrp/AsnC family transcriptional regulator for asnA, asnC and gidA